MTGMLTSWFTHYVCSSAHTTTLDWIGMQHITCDYTFASIRYASHVLYCSHACMHTPSQNRLEMVV